MIEISGKNIVLRTMNLKEARALWRKYVAPEGEKEYIYNEEEVDSRFEAAAKKEEWNPAVGIFTKNGEIIGELTFERIVFSEQRCELYLFMANESYRGKGLGSEAITLAKKYAKDKLGLARIHCDVPADNIPMQKALKKCKFMHTKTLDGGKTLRYFSLL